MHKSSYRVFNAVRKPYQWINPISADSQERHLGAPNPLGFWPSSKGIGWWVKVLSGETHGFSLTFARLPLASAAVIQRGDMYTKQIHSGMSNAFSCKIGWFPELVYWNIEQKMVWPCLANGFQSSPSNTLCELICSIHHAFITQKRVFWIFLVICLPPS